MDELIRHFKNLEEDETLKRIDDAYNRGWNDAMNNPEVKKALERMKPKKIVSTFWSDSSKGFSELHGRFTCPTCNGELDDYRYDISFCPYEGCGQALDWSE